MSFDAHLLSPRTAVDGVRVGWEKARTTIGRRGRVSSLLWVAAGSVAVFVLLPHAGALVDSLPALAAVHPGWLLAASVMVALRYVIACVSLRAAVGRPLEFGPTLLVELSASFAGRLTPGNVGWLVLNQRYLERCGLARSTAAASIALRLGAGAVARVVLVAAVAALAGATLLGHLEPPALPRAGAIVAGVAVVLLAAVVLARRVSPYHWSPAVAAMAHVQFLARQPRRAAVLLGSCALLTVSSPLLLVASVGSVGVTLSPLEVTAMYLAASAVASASPTPGNLGAIEVALSAGLAALGVLPGQAVAAVLVFRLLTFWLPIVPGLLAMRYLERTAQQTSLIEPSSPG